MELFCLKRGSFMIKNRRVFKNTIVTPLVRASFLCEESKPIERDEQNEKTKNGSICDPFWSFCSELLNVV